KEINALGIASVGPEAISCLLLEVWFSEIQRSITKMEAEDKRSKLFENLFKPDAEDLPSISELLIGKNPDSVEMLKYFVEPEEKDRKKRYEALKEIESVGFAVELYKAIRLLFDLLYDSGIIEQLAKNPDTDIAPIPGTVAVRHSYKTITKYVSEFDPHDPYVPL